MRAAMAAAATALILAQSASQPYVGTWTADLNGQTYVRLELTTTDGVLGGKVSLGDIHVNSAGEVEAVTPQVHHVGLSRMQSQLQSSQKSRDQRTEQRTSASQAFSMPPRRRVPHLRCGRHRRRRVLGWLALLPRPATVRRAGRCGHTERGTDGSDSSWPQGTVGAGAHVTFQVGVVGSDEHAPSRLSPLDTVEAGDLPSDAVLLSASSPVLCPPPTSHAAPAWLSQ